MKYLRFIIPLVFLSFACTEEIIKYIEEKPEIIEKIIEKIDTVYIPKETVVYDTIVEYDTIIEVDTVVICHVRIDTVIIELTDTVFVTREAKLTYPPEFEPYITKFFDYAERGWHLQERLIVDVHFYHFFPNFRHPVVDATVLNGRWEIGIYTFEGCLEDIIYRELANKLYGRTYAPSLYDGIMNPSWTDHLIFYREECFEAMSTEERAPYLTELFGIPE